jgi:ribonuclease-3
MSNSSTTSSENLPYNPNNILFDSDNINSFLTRFGLPYNPNLNEAFYRRAMVHKSYITRKNENFLTGNEKCPRDCIPLQENSNERYEFLGDAILGCVIADYLYRRYPTQNEGFLTKMRSKLVNGKKLAEICEEIGLNKWILISKQIEETEIKNCLRNGKNKTGRQNMNILEDAFEAFICAIYFDYNQIESKKTSPFIETSLLDTNGLGFQMAQTWIIGVYEEIVDFSYLVRLETNHKDKLIKYYQNNYMKTPQYYEKNVEIITGNKKIYTIIIRESKHKDALIIGIGKGESKKKAEQNASKNALDKLRIE